MEKVAGVAKEAVHGKQEMKWFMGKVRAA